MLFEVGSISDAGNGKLNTEEYRLILIDLFGIF